MALTIYYTDNFSGRREASRPLLCKAVSLYTGAAVTPEDVRTAPGGKPYIEGGPHFSVTHSERYWAVLFADVPCGIDVQVPRTTVNVRIIARRVFSERETNLVTQLGQDAFYQIWTRREALVKSAGRSVFAEDVPELLLPPGEEVLKVNYQGAPRAVMDLDVPSGLFAAVAWTVDEGWIAAREVPTMRRFTI